MEHQTPNPGHSSPRLVPVEEVPRLCGRTAESGRGSPAILGRKLGLPNVRRGDAVRDGGRLQPVRRAELAQDVRDVDAGRPDADHQGRRDLAVGVAAGDQGQDLRLARREAEDLLEALLPFGRPGVRRRELQPRALGEQSSPAAASRADSRGRPSIVSTSVSMTYTRCSTIGSPCSSACRRACRRRARP